MREQYSLAKILGIWALATVPMGILSWIVSPLLAPDFESYPLEFGVTRIVLLALGLIWLFVLSMIIVRQEEGSLRWATVKQRLRLNVPREPTTGQPRARLFLWVVPFIVAVAVIELVLNTPIENAWVSVFPFLAEPEGYSFDAILGSQEILQRLVGAWWFFALFVISAVFNTILGEEFLFRVLIHRKLLGVVSAVLVACHPMLPFLSSQSGRALAQDGRCVWSLELGGKQCTLRFLSRSRALGNT
jgi:membrane protease YdiL (CAAX protease family)